MLLSIIFFDVDDVFDLFLWERKKETLNANSGLFIGMELFTVADKISIDHCSGYLNVLTTLFPHLS